MDRFFREHKVNRVYFNGSDDQWKVEAVDVAINYGIEKCLKVDADNLNIFICLNGDDQLNIIKYIHDLFSKQLRISTRTQIPWLLKFYLTYRRQD